MFRLRLTVTQLRVLILGANIILTGAVGAHVYYRYANEYDMPGNVDDEMSRNLEEFKTKGTGAAGSENHILRVRGTGSGFIEVRAPIIAPPVTWEPDVETEEPPVGVLPPGPLEEGWEFEGAILYSDASGKNWAIIRKKVASGPTIGGRTPTVITNVRTTPRIVRSPTSIPGRRNPATAQPDPGVRMVQVGDSFPLEEEGEGPIIRALEITAAQFIYEEVGKPHRYALRRKTHRSYKDGLAPPPPSETDPNNPQAAAPEEVKTTHFVVGGDPPTSEERLQELLQKQGAGSAPGTGAAGTKSMRPSEGASPKTQAEQLQQLRSTIDQIPEAERKKLNDILRKPRTIQQK